MYLSVCESTPSSFTLDRHALLMIKDAMTTKHASMRELTFYPSFSLLTTARQHPVPPGPANDPLQLIVPRRAPFDIIYYAPYLDAVITTLVPLSPRPRSINGADSLFSPTRGWVWSRRPDLERDATGSYDMCMVDR